MGTRRIPMTFAVLMALTYTAAAEISVTAYSKDEGLHEKNISKPRIFIENTGTEPISDFYYLYYFTAEGGNRPVLENYYTPNQSVSLIHLGHNRYAVRYDCSGVTLYPGEVFPDPNGNVVGIHYPNWAPLCKSNDRSFNFSSDFEPNGNIAVFCSDGYQPQCHRHVVRKTEHVVYKDVPDQASVKVKFRVRK